jgi:ribonuclease T2
VLLGYGVDMKQIGIGLGLGVGVLVALAAIPIFLAANPNPTGDTITRTQTKSDRIPRGTGFDFYVLALSWSPSYCQDSGAAKRDVIQCAGTRPFAFVVHGLWPQFERGYPRSCRSAQQRPSQSDIRAMLDVMPSERLVQHEWETHGTCSGLSARDYLKVVRAAAQAVTIPSDFDGATQWRRISAGEVEAAFVSSNPDMTEAGIGVAKRGNLLSEVRVCLTLELKPRTCPEVDRGGAGPQTKLSLPPSRG